MGMNWFDVFPFFSLVFMPWLMEGEICIWNSDLSYNCFLCSFLRFMVDGEKDVWYVYAILNCTFFIFNNQKSLLIFMKLWLHLQISLAFNCFWKLIITFSRSLKFFSQKSNWSQSALGPYFKKERENTK